MTESTLSAALDLLRREIEVSYERVRELPVTPVVQVEELRAAVAAQFDLDAGRPLPDVVASASDLLRRYSLQITHPRYFGLFNPSVHLSGIIADALVALFNPQVGGWTHGPAANEMERLVLRRLTSSLGLPVDETAAHFTSGGNEANHTAVLAALAWRHAEWPERGLRALPKQPVIYLSAESHHSFTKVARATGLGTAALRPIPVDSQLRMQVRALEEQITRDRKEGLAPLMLVATAGTTGAGAIDPLRQLAGIAGRESLWYHIDAAWGGAAALVPRLRSHLDGIAHADSVTFDAHKWLSVPLGACVFFTRPASVLPTAFGVHTGYVPPTIEGGVDLYKHSMQWSRRFIGLKLLFAFAEHGEAGIARFIDTIVTHADGDITIESAEGVGTSVHIHLPVARTARERMMTPVTQPRLPGNESILIVEDEPAVRQFSVNVLEQLGYRVSAVADGVQALRYLEEDPEVDAIVTDVVMPHMGGPALIRTLAERGKLYPVVFMSGYTSDGAALEDLMTDRSCFLGKPFGPGELGAAVRRVLDPVETRA